MEDEFESFYRLVTTVKHKTWIQRILEDVNYIHVPCSKFVFVCLKKGGLFSFSLLTTLVTYRVDIPWDLFRVKFTSLDLTLLDSRVNQVKVHTLFLQATVRVSLGTVPGEGCAHSRHPAFVAGGFTRAWGARKTRIVCSFACTSKLVVEFRLQNLL